MKPSRILGVVAAVMLVVGVVTFLNRGNPDGNQLVRAVQNGRRPVQTRVLAAETLHETVVQTGVLRAARDATLSAAVGGRVDRIVRDMGDACRSGEAVAQLDAEPYRIASAQAEAGLAQARAAHEQAQRELRRTRRLAEQSVTTQRALDAAQSGADGAAAALQQAEAGVHLAQRNLRESAVRCPFSGVVAERLVEVGAFVGPQTPVVRLVDTAKLLLPLSVSADELRRLRVGQPVEVTSAADPGLRAAGEVTRLGVAGDRITRSFPVEVAVPGGGSDGPMLRPGQVVTARIEVATFTAAVSLPVDAVATGPEGAMAWRVVDGKAQAAQLVLGPRLGERVVVQAGLSPGDEVVVVGVGGLQEGAALLVVGSTGAAAGDAEATPAAAKGPQAHDEPTPSVDSLQLQ